LALQNSPCHRHALGLLIAGASSPFALSLDWSSSGSSPIFPIHSLDQGREPMYYPQAHILWNDAGEPQK